MKDTSAGFVRSASGGQSDVGCTRNCAGRYWGAIALGCALLTVGLHSILPAYGQTTSEEDVQNYARALVDIEDVRVQAYEEAANILSSDTTELSMLDVTLSCLRTRMRDMPDVSRSARVELRTVLITYCNQAQTIAEVNDLTPKRFNAITSELKEDESLAERIKDAIKAL